ncbi:hypothetical protein ZHAS_00006574 [Anopheles sinensis]|uniref:Uncharacterized protein n=1 Tax=Anopheles sinensis TaxID=74873 RepID=A0A084VMN6_ANOSI|nr:hypothetical protein ZHAS_00006574 [Anopheles sinensis]
MVGHDRGRPPSGWDDKYHRPRTNWKDSQHRSDSRLSRTTKSVLNEGDLAVVMHQTHSPGPGRQQQRRRRRRRRSQSRGLAFPRLDNDAPKNSRAIRHYPVPSIGRTGALYMGKKHGAMKNGQQIIDHMSPTDAAERHGSLFPRARPFAARNQRSDPST